MKLRQAGLGLVAAIVCTTGVGAARDAKKREATPASWPGTELPLPLAVRTPHDLAFKALAERHYLVFNLLAGGKAAFDAGDFASAALKWEALLQLPRLDAEIDKQVRPLLIEARQKLGRQDALLPQAAQQAADAEKAGAAEGEPKSDAAGDAKADASAEPKAGGTSKKRRGSVVTVEGSVSGGGPAGPGGAVVTMKRVGGRMPRLTPASDKVVSQRNKAFVPRVLAVPVGSSVAFHNEDPLAHNVFSISPTRPFDTGLYKAPGSASVVFDKPGVVQILCNIHSAMVGYVVVVDTPYYAQADAKGAFTVRGVLPGDYDLELWHESASQPTRLRVAVGRDGSLSRGGNPVELSVSGDQQAPAFPPDKYGKPRQPQLGY